MTTYNGTAITYDEIGNPNGYNDRTFTWEHGRQRKSLGEKVKNRLEEVADTSIQITSLAITPPNTWVLVGIHYLRNVFNTSYAHESELGETCEPLDEKADKFHQNDQRGGRNRKYVIGDWFSSEVVFYADGTLNNTPEDTGTFNVYYGKNGFLNFVIHGPLDVFPYMVWGNSPRDTTSIFDRWAMIRG